jgi:hypothetical protein
MGKRDSLAYENDVYAVGQNDELQKLLGGEVESPDAGDSKINVEEISKALHHKRSYDVHYMYRKRNEKRRITRMLEEKDGDKYQDVCGYEGKGLVAFAHQEDVGYPEDAKRPHYDKH